MKELIKTRPLADTESATGLTWGTTDALHEHLRPLIRALVEQLARRPGAGRVDGRREATRGAGIEARRERSPNFESFAQRFDPTPPVGLRCRPTVDVTPRSHVWQRRSQSAKSA